MIDGYAMGITPNPDILCNRKMKFGALKNYAQENDFNGLATGHYCKKAFDKDGNALLLEGRIKIKINRIFWLKFLRINLITPCSPWVI